MGDTIKSHQKCLCHVPYSRIHLGEICFLSALCSHQWPARCSPGVVIGSKITEMVITGARGAIRASGFLYQSYTSCMHRVSWSKLEVA